MSVPALTVMLRDEASGEPTVMLRDEASGVGTETDSFLHPSRQAPAQSDNVAIPKGYWVDTHLHLDDPQFRHDVDAVIDNAVALGAIGLLNIAYCPASWSATRELAGRRPEIAVACGLHPNSAGMFTRALLDELRATIARDKPVAIGETGLDYFRDRAERTMQLAAFRAQVDLAVETGLPLILHLRGDVEEDLRHILEAAPGPLVCVFHSFDGSPGLAEYVIKHNWYIGVGGLATKPANESLRAIIASMPLDRLVLETDSPYLPPRGVKARRNEPANVPLVAAMLADIKGIDPATVFYQTTLNAINLFGSRVAPLIELTHTSPLAAR